jgi:hypothetical protein
MDFFFLVWGPGSGFRAEFNGSLELENTMDEL